MNVNPDEYVVLKRDVLHEKFVSIGGPQCTVEETDTWIDEHRMPLMTIPEFQKSMADNSVRWFPQTIKDGQIDLHMLLYGIGGEAGEILDEMKKFLRGSLTEAELRERLAIESVDCFHYIAMLWYVLGIDAGEYYLKITEANEKRFGPQA